MVCSAVVFLVRENWDFIRGHSGYCKILLSDFYSIIILVLCATHFVTTRLILRFCVKFTEIMVFAIPRFFSNSHTVRLQFAVTAIRKRSTCRFCHCNLTSLIALLLLCCTHNLIPISLIDEFDTNLLIRVVWCHTKECLSNWRIQGSL